MQKVEKHQETIGKLLWSPSANYQESTLLWAFKGRIEEKYAVNLPD